MAKATKSGVRVSVLATELGIESKDIIAKLKKEGLDWAKNHMSTVTFGQAETLREWSREGVLGAPKPATARVEAGAVEGGRAEEQGGEGEHEVHMNSGVRRKTAEQGGDDGNVAVAEAPADEETNGGQAFVQAEIPAAPEKQVEVVGKAPAVAEAHSAEPAAEAPAAPVVEAAATAAPVVARLTPTVIAPPTPPVAETPAAGGGTSAGAVETPGAPVAKPAVPPARPTVAPPARTGAVPPRHGVDQLRQQVQRPTITLDNRNKQAPPVRPQPFVPAKASIQGPKVVRVEKPDHVAAPRPKRPIGDGPSNNNNTGLNTARAQAGRGVKRTDEEEDQETKDKKAGRPSLSTRRRGADGRRGEADEKLREFSDADLIERKERLEQAGKTRQEFDAHLKKSSQRGTHQQAKSAQQKGEPVALEQPITVRSLSAALGVKANEIITKLMRSGVMANINQSLDLETAQTLALDYGIEVQLKEEATLEQLLEREFANRESKPENLVTRPPVVTILGHVDHGKTSLLDKIRSANVAAGEAGGITQHIAAWMVTLGEGDKQKRVTFIDTPGHQAFTGMRARGANMTDVVVLVVSAAEGVQPQTIESINHAKAAEVPIVVALNKIDRADANPDMVLGQLASNGLQPVEYGGDTEVVRVSALTGKGIPELIEILDLQSQIMELKADPTSPATGTVIESSMNPGLGAASTVLVQNGTLKVGDVVLCGNAYGRVRSLVNDKGVNITEAGPSTPVIIAGLDGLPSSGDKFFVMDSQERAKTIAEDRAMRARQLQLGAQSRVTGENLLSTIASRADVKTINLIIKADVQGSLETLVATVTSQNTTEVKVRVIHSGVGAVTESDVQLAMATRTKPQDNRVAIIGFHVVPEEAARALAEQNHIDVKTYRVIYEIFDDLKKSLSGMLEPEIREKLHGHAEVRAVFKFQKRNIAGCMVTDGHIQRGSKIRVIRDGRIIVEDQAIETLRRVKDDAKEVKSGLECGIKLVNFDDIKEGDRFEAYIREKFERTL